MINLDWATEPEDMPLCPLCDQPIYDNAEIVIFTAHEMFAIAHEDCAPQEDSGDE